jgi:hypothetical protein
MQPLHDARTCQVRVHFLCGVFERLMCTQDSCCRITSADQPCQVTLAA